ncbi:hypothetical protein [Embleya hyalina]|uniref:Uncharacterized protein n=1 Tax=Embleya hyalina TaxID=516124 RepID=A0A401YYR8_9ACTN|nr:hypothetical protein [Embleya hyalina]GCD99733.1 hypothetical protein EHYA_07455 [Embleya hyalina]
MDTSMPGPDARHINPRSTVTSRAAMAARLDALLDIPIELFDGMPGTTTARARDLLDIDPYIAIRARALMNTVMHGRTRDTDTILLVVASPELTTEHMDRVA